MKKDGKMKDKHTEVINSLKNEEDKKIKEEKVQLLLDTRGITQAEPEEILNN